MYSNQPSLISIHPKIRRWVLLVSAIVFLGNVLAHGSILSRSTIGNRTPEDHGAPLGLVLMVSVFSPTLLNVVSIKKSIHYFHLMHQLADDRVSYKEYISINPTYGSGILKPGHHQEAFLHLDLPPPL